MKFIIAKICEKKKEFEIEDDIDDIDETEKEDDEGTSFKVFHITFIIGTNVEIRIRVIE